MNIWCWSSLTPGHTPPKWQVLHIPPGLRLTHGKFYLSFMQWGNSVGSGLTLLQHWGLRDVQDLTTQMPWSLGGMLWAETKAQSGSCMCLGVNPVQCEKKKKVDFLMLRIFKSAHLATVSISTFLLALRMPARTTVSLAPQSPQEEQILEEVWGITEVWSECCS